MTANARFSFTLTRTSVRMPFGSSMPSRNLSAWRPQTLPPSLTLTIVQDMTTIIRERLAMLVKNGVIGIVLVIAVMSLFFHPAYAIWAALGLPVAFLGAFAVMAMTGLSLNMITLVALLMAIGIVMDDSIVISDAIAEEPRTAGTAMTRAIRGTQKVLPGVLSSFLTTVAVFGAALVPGWRPRRRAGSSTDRADCCARCEPDRSLLRPAASPCTWAERRRQTLLPVPRHL